MLVVYAIIRLKRQFKRLIAGNSNQFIIQSNLIPISQSRGVHGAPSVGAFFLSPKLMITIINMHGCWIRVIQKSNCPHHPIHFQHHWEFFCLYQITRIFISVQRENTDLYLFFHSQEALIIFCYNKYDTKRKRSNEWMNWFNHANLE